MCVSWTEDGGGCVCWVSIYVDPSPPFEQVAAWRVLFHLRAADRGISKGGRDRTASFLLLFCPPCLFSRRDYHSVSFYISCVRPWLKAIFNLEGPLTLSTHTPWTMSCSFQPSCWPTATFQGQFPSHPTLSLTHRRFQIKSVFIIKCRFVTKVISEYLRQLRCIRVYHAKISSEFTETQHSFMQPATVGEKNWLLTGRNLKTDLNQHKISIKKPKVHH